MLAGLNNNTGYVTVVCFRLANLTQLKELDLGYNKFNRGLPPVVTKMTSLETLRLKTCELEELPTE